MEFEFFLLINPCSLDSELKKLGPGKTFIKAAGINKKRVNVLYALRLLQAFCFRMFIDEKGHRRIESVEHWLETGMPDFFDEELQKIILNEDTGILAGLTILHKQLTLLNPFWVGPRMYKNEVEILDL